jgi:RNA polymerase sigma-70 factor (ECF subfamily)
MLYSQTQKSIPQYSDEEAIKQILAGNPALYEILIRRYNPFLYKTGRGYGFNHHDTEDLMQETFINCYQNLSSFQYRSSFKTWAIKIMIHQCYHKAHKLSYQNEKPFEEFFNNNSESMFLKPKQGDPGKTVLNKELSHVIEAAINKLPQDYRVTFTLRELTGLSVFETADMMHTTTSNVKVRLNRAKMMLRKEIEKIYSSDDIYEFNLVYCDKIVNAVMKKILSSRGENTVL